MTYVKRRLRTRILKGGYIKHNERRISWGEADRLAKRRLDRRKNYCIIKGQVCSAVRWTSRCSGCSDSFCDDRSAGCHECGYRGVVRHEMWMPDDGSMPR